ncbi:MAG: hypothetical protein DMD77_05330 [Candidatus Rokuibacteriota bacterium]|nr:MAG: hypothetical protein DMD77_05330 [Candidatus Rokubacteria bacterium]
MSRADKPPPTSRRSCQSGDQAQWEPQAAKAALAIPRTRARTMYREMDMGFWLEKAEAEMREFR